jgi:hypothetical protein
VLFRSFGTPGADDLFGYEGKDTIHGSDGNDVITGGPGFDTLYGEGGDDTYIWNIGDGNVMATDVFLCNSCPLHFEAEIFLKCCKLLNIDPRLPPICLVFLKKLQGPIWNAHSILALLLK